MRIARRWAPTVLVLYVAALAAGTLGPSPAELFEIVTVQANEAGLDQVTWRSVEVTANVVLFVPLGFLVRAALPRLSGWFAWMLCSGASASVEVVQSVLPDRQPSLLDLATNSAGAAVGVLLATALIGRAGWRTRPRTSGP